MLLQPQQNKTSFCLVNGRTNIGTIPKIKKRASFYFLPDLPTYISSKHYQTSLSNSTDHLKRTEKKFPKRFQKEIIWILILSLQLWEKADIIVLTIFQKRHWPFSNISHIQLEIKKLLNEFRKVITKSVCVFFFNENGGHHWKNFEQGSIQHWES